MSINIIFVGALWKKLDKETRDRYEAQSAQERISARQRLASWRKRMEADEASRASLVRFDELRKLKRVLKIKLTRLEQAPSIDEAAGKVKPKKPRQKKRVAKKASPKVGIKRASATKRLVAKKSVVKKSSKKGKPSKK